MRNKYVLPYANKIAALKAIVGNSLEDEAIKAKDRWSIYRDKVEEIVRQMQFVVEDSVEYISLREELSMALATKERMEIAVSIWDTVLKVYDKAENEYDRLYAKMKEDGAA